MKARSRTGQRTGSGTGLRKDRKRAVWCLMALLVAPMGIAQQPASQPDSTPPREPASQPEPNADPAPTTPETEQTRRRHEAAEDGLAPSATPDTTAAPAAKPKAPPESGIPVPKTRRAREGVFVVKQPGELLVARTGDVVFVPDKGAPVRTSRPMVLLPCQALARLESAAGLRGDVPTAAEVARPRAILTGQIMVYRQREYLLPTVFQIEMADQSPAVVAKEPVPASSTAVDGDATVAENRDREVEAFINELEDRRTKNRGLVREMAEVAATPATQAGGPAEGALVAGDATGKTWNVPEGSVITARRGRLVRLGDGAVGVAFDNGMTPGGTGRRSEAAMALQPCQLMQRMEEVVGGLGDRAAIEVSGRVFSYGGRSYLLPTMYKVLPPSDVGPLD